MYKRIVVKIGTNLIVDEKGLKEKFLKDFVEQASLLHKKGVEIIMVSSGAIGTGLLKIKINRKSFSLPEKQAIAAIGQPFLMKKYIKMFEEKGITVAQVLLNHDDVNDKTRNANARNTLNKLIEWRVIPVVNENDTVATEEIKFGDNDALAGIVGSLINADCVLILTSVDGVYDKNPMEHKDAKIIKVIDDMEKTISEVETDGKTSHGTGGMLSKLQTAMNLHLAGIPHIIANGNSKDVLLRTARGENTGTLINSRNTRIESRKRWILIALKSRGAVVLDKGAEEALVKSGKSLLAVGITSLHGKFAFGDAVDILNSKGEKIAKGISNYSSEDMKKIIGKKNAEIQKILGEGFYKEAFHRDNIVILKTF